MTRRELSEGLRLPMSTDVFVRSAMALVQGSMTRRLIEPGSLRAGELEQTVVPLVLGLTT